MATPRVTLKPPAKLDCRQPDDFPGFVEALEKLTDLQSQRELLEVEFRKADLAAAKNPPNSIDQEARALLNAESADDDVPDLAAMRRELEVYRRAIEMQADVLNQQRSVMAREISRDLADEHRALIKSFIAKQHEATTAYQKLLELRSSANALTGTETLPPYAINAQKQLVFVTECKDFESRTSEYLKGAMQ